MDDEVQRHNREYKVHQKQISKISSDIENRTVGMEHKPRTMDVTMNKEAGSGVLRSVVIQKFWKFDVQNLEESDDKYVTILGE